MSQCVSLWIHLNKNSGFLVLDVCFFPLVRDIFSLYSSKKLFARSYSVTCIMQTTLCLMLFYISLNLHFFQSFSSSIWVNSTVQYVNSQIAFFHFICSAVKPHYWIFQFSYSALFCLILTYISLLTFLLCSCIIFLRSLHIFRTMSPVKL